MRVIGAVSKHVHAADTVEMVRRLPTLRVETVANAGHAVQSDQPRVLAELPYWQAMDAASRHYVQRQPDWPASYELVGFTSWHGPDGGRLPADVVAFLADGPPPVIVTLGSSGASAKPELFEQVAAPIDRLAA